MIDIGSGRLARMLAIGAAAAWACFALLTVLVVNSPLGTSLDAWLAPLLYDATAASPARATLGRVLDVVGGNLVGVVTVLAVSVLLALRGRGRLAAFLMTSAIGGVLICSAVKGLVDRPRPPTTGSLIEETTASYPSGHATASVTVVLALAVVAWLTLGRVARWMVAAPLVLLALAIGVSRVALGVHWPTDVLGGWALGAAWSMSVALVLVLVWARQDAGERGP